MVEVRKRGVPVRDGSGRGVGVNVGRGGCVPVKRVGRGIGRGVGRGRRTL